MTHDGIEEMKSGEEIGEMGRKLASLFGRAPLNNVLHTPVSAAMPPGAELRERIPLS